MKRYALFMLSAIAISLLAPAAFAQETGARVDLCEEEAFRDPRLMQQIAGFWQALVAEAPATRLYADEKGESHFQDVEVEFEAPTPSGRVSARQKATGIIFREVPPDYDLDWHPAPRRQYIINLDAGVQLTASDGESRRIKAGEVVLVEDTWGKGHLSKAVAGKMRHSIFVPIE